MSPHRTEYPHILQRSYSQNGGVQRGLLPLFIEERLERNWVGNETRGIGAITVARNTRNAELRFARPSSCRS